MSTLLKDLYAPVFYDRFAAILMKVMPSFDKPLFLEKILTTEFKEMELKQRMKHTTAVLHEFFPAKYADTVKLIEKIIKELRKAGESGLVYMFLPDYIETYGLEHYDHSVKALEFITQFITCEFAVRPFIIRYGDRMIEQMTSWSLHESNHVRRFASEGSRPRLPWAMGLPALKKDPSPILPLLDNLKNDPEAWVRRSVANNLNDIAKDHPQIILEIAARWKGIGKETDAIIKHGSRTLLKQGHVEILKFYGLESQQLDVSGFKVITPQVAAGQHLGFSFTVQNNHRQPQTVRIEYAIYYRKQNGTLSRKVFKISERIYQPGEKVSVVRKQSFRPITTRKFYPGEHRVGVIINGEEKVSDSFVLAG